MSGKVFLTRRYLLGVAATGLVLSHVPTLAGPQSPFENSIVGQLETLFSDLPSIQNLGRAYLAATPGEAGRAQLTALIFGTERPQSTHELMTYLAGKRHRDFVDGDVAIVDGWVIAKTEGRVAAMLCTPDRKAIL